MRGVVRWGAVRILVIAALTAGLLGALARHGGREASPEAGGEKRNPGDVGRIPRDARLPGCA